MEARECSKDFCGFLLRLEPFGHSQSKWNRDPPRDLSPFPCFRPFSLLYVVACYARHVTTTRPTSIIVIISPCNNYYSSITTVLLERLTSSVFHVLQYSTTTMTTSSSSPSFSVPSDYKYPPQGNNDEWKLPAGTYLRVVVGNNIIMLMYVKEFASVVRPSVRHPLIHYGIPLRSTVRRTTCTPPFLLPPNNIRTSSHQLFTK
jgi:hypothetical protein